MPTLTLEVDTQTEQRLKQMEARHGDTADRIAARLLTQSVENQSAADAVPLSQLSEAELLQKIGEGWDTALWKRYDQLVKKRKAETFDIKRV